MQAPYSCPFCRSAISIDDVNVATDIALCRACGKTVPFSTISGSSELSSISINQPPRGIKIERGFRGDTTIIYRKLSPVLFFLIPFTAAWSGFSMYGIYFRQFRSGKFDLSESLFGLPFLLGTIVLVSVIAFLLLGQWKIRLENGTGSVFVGAGPLGWTRNFTYNQSSLVSLRMTNMRVNEVPQRGILIRTDDKDLIFGTVLKDDAKQFIAAIILHEVGRA